MRIPRAKTLAAAAAISSAVAFTATDSRRPEDDPALVRLFTKERAESVLATDPSKSGKDRAKDEIRPFLKEYPIVRGDFPAALASRHSITLEEFLSLNRLFGVRAFVDGRKTPILRVGETYLAPEDPSAVRPFFAKIARLEKADRISEAISNGADVRKLRRISGETFFPREPECLGLGEVLSSMLEMQKDEFDPLLPVIVDPRIERTASCANLIKYAFIQSCNLKYYAPAQRKMLLTPDLHAWVLVRKLRDEFGYVQSHTGLMKAFDLKAFQSFNPITDPEKRTKYDEEIRAVYRFLRDGAPQGTIVPMYFQGSRSKAAVMGEYRPGDPHLNTHQTMLAGNIDWTLKASSIPAVRDGKRLMWTADRTVVDLLTDFVASRADFPSSFLPNFRNTVRSGLVRYPELVEIEIDGRRIDVAAELAALRAGKPQTVVKPGSDVRLTGPMMLDGEIQSTHDDKARTERMNARTRFFFEFATTIYLPTEVLSPKEDTLPERGDFQDSASGLAQKYLYSLRRGNTLASVLKERIARYEDIDPADPKAAAKIAEHFKWQIRGLKMDGFLQSENEFNPGAVNENRIIPYYDVRTVPPVWKEYLAERRSSELEFEKEVGLPYLRVTTIDGAGIDSKRKFFREIVDRMLASESRLAEYPELRGIANFNEFQYELFMKRFFERSSNDSGAKTSVEFYADMRPNRTFFVQYSDLADIVAEISDAAALETPKLRELDEALIDAVVPNRHNASLAKNVLATETYAVEGGSGVRMMLKRFGQAVWSNRSKGDFQIRMLELDGAYVRGGRVYRTERGIEVPVEWPTVRNLREASGSVFSPEVYEISKKFLSSSASARFERDAKRFEELRRIIARDDLSPKEFRKFFDGVGELMCIDPGDGSNLVGKAFSAALLDSKISLHYRKTSYWLAEMGIPFEYLAESDEERSKYERTVALVNNLSEDRVLLALAENQVIRILSDGLGIEIRTDDVYAKPSGFMKSLYQKVSMQLYYDRKIFFSHFDAYLAAARESVAEDDYALSHGFVGPTAQSVAEKKAVIEKLSEYRRILGEARNFNAEALAFFRDAELRSLLVRKSLPWTPFPTSEELSSDPFRSSVFNYVGKMERRIREGQPARQTRVFLGFLRGGEK